MIDNNPSVAVNKEQQTKADAFKPMIMEYDIFKNVQNIDSLKPSSKFVYKET